MHDTNSTNYQPWIPTQRQLRLASYAALAFIGLLLTLMLYGAVGSIVAARAGESDLAPNAAVYLTGAIIFTLGLLFAGFRHKRMPKSKGGPRLDLVRETTEQWKQRDEQEGQVYRSRLWPQRWEPHPSITPWI